MTTVDQAANATSIQPPRRWRPRLTIRVMIAIVAVVALILSGWVSRPRRLSWAIQAIRKASGVVVFAEEPLTSADFRDRNGRPARPVPGPALLRRFLGDDAFQTVATVSFYSNSLEDMAVFRKAMEGLAGIPSGFMLSAHSPEVAKEVLDHTSLFPDLEGITLSHASKTDDDAVRKICLMRGLRHVVIRSSLMNEDAAISLASLPRLESLHLEGTKLTDRSLKGIGQASHLVELRIEIDPNRVTDDGLKALRDLKSLKTLILLNKSFTQAETDRFIEAIPNLETLKSNSPPGFMTMYTVSGLAIRREEIRLERLHMKR